LPNEAKQNVKEWRAAKDVFTESEEAKMALITSIYQTNFNTQSPVFGIEKKKFLLYEYQKSSWKVSPDDLSPMKWLQKTKGKDGDFINEAKDVIERVCAFQTAKKGSYRDGYMNTPKDYFARNLKLGPQPNFLFWL